jgi:hypothetical protein
VRKRIVLAIVGITALAVVGFGVPLAITVAHMYRTEAISALERDANAGLAEVTLPLNATDRPELPVLTDGAHLSVYNAHWQRIAGDGPAVGDEAVQAAAAGPVNRSDLNGSLVVALPVGNDENVAAIVEATLPEQVVTDRVHRAWVAMGALGLAVIGAAALVAAWEARRLSRPVIELARSAERLGQRDFGVRTARSGVPELDTVGAALDKTAERRSSSANVGSALTHRISCEHRSRAFASRSNRPTPPPSPTCEPRSEMRCARWISSSRRSTICCRSRVTPNQPPIRSSFTISCRKSIFDGMDSLRDPIDPSAPRLSRTSPVRTPPPLQSARSSTC